VLSLTAADPRIRPGAELRVASVIAGLAALGLLAAMAFNIIDDDISAVLLFAVGHFCLAYGVAHYPVALLPLGWCALPWIGPAFAWVGVIIMLIAVFLARPQARRFPDAYASPASE
jgi:hypothetical protein